MRVATVAMLVGLGGTAAAQAVGDRVFDTTADPAFRAAPLALDAYLADQQQTGVHHFCVVGFRGRDAKRAWVYWREGRQIILWDEAAVPIDAVRLLVSSRRVLDLDRDVVETTADVRGSTYLVTRDWVRRIRRTCLARGRYYQIRR